MLSVDDTAAAAEARRYGLPEGHAEVLVVQDSLSYLAYAGRFSVALAQAMPGLLRAFQQGGGVSWADFGVDAREAQAEQNRPIFLSLLGNEWLPSVADLHARLQQPSARVADIGCGAGWSAIAMAQA